MQALITGAGGFVGGHLSTYLLTHTDWEITGSILEPATHRAVDHPRLQFRPLDLRDELAVASLFGEIHPDVIFHLAAQSSVSTSFSNAWETLENNLRAQLNLLEAVRQSGCRATCLIVGSNEEYGAPKPEELPQTEQSPLRPNNPYAVSKIGQDFMGLQYHLTYDIPVVRVRPFNHTGPGQSPRFVAPAFASQIARIEAGLQAPVIRVGNLSTARDFSDVRDIVRGYHLAVIKGEPGEVYNLASGKPQAIQALLDTLLEYSDVEIQVETDPARYRPADVPVVYGSAERFRAQTGWEPEIPFEQTLRDTLTYWREQVSSK